MNGLMMEQSVACWGFELVAAFLGAKPAVSSSGDEVVEGLGQGPG